MIALAAALVAAMLQTMPAGVKTVEKGALSNVGEARQVVVRTDAEWVRLWQQHGRERERPAINFATDMVLGVFMGSRSNAGYRIDILSTTPHEGKLVVRYRETMPKRDAITAQVITSPFHLVAVPAFAGEIVFEKAEPEK
jgi:PrcB C-terminal